MIQLDNIAKFQLFCLENYKAARGIAGKDALVDFKHYHVFDFLSENYEVLHTQGKNYILTEINNYIENRQ